MNTDHGRRTYYRVCPICGSSLDPGEICDCEYSTKIKNSSFFGNDLVLKIRCPTKESDAIKY